MSGEESVSRQHKGSSSRIGSLFVRDFKFGTRRRPQSDVDASTQLTLYSIGTRFIASIGDVTPDVGLEQMVDLKKGPQRDLKTSVRGPADYAALVARVNAFSVAVSKGVFPPADPTSWRCSDRYCPFYRDCVYVRGT